MIYFPFPDHNLADGVTNTVLARVHPWTIEPPRSARPFSMMPNTANGSAPLILVADDEETLRENAERILTEAGYRVVTVCNGEECIAAYQALGPQQVALVITDFAMPVMNGDLTLYRLLEINPDARVLLNSASLTRADVASLLEAGAAGSIPKPYTQAVYLQAVTRTLQETSPRPVSDPGRNYQRPALASIRARAA